MCIRDSSQVVEMKLDDGTWMAFMTERLPQVVDDEIKKHHAALFMASQLLTVEQLFDKLPICFPMTHPIPEFPFVARYPVDLWNSENRPFMDEDSWLEFTKMIARNDLDHLASVFKVCEDYKVSKDKSAEKAQRKADVRKEVQKEVMKAAEADALKEADAYVTLAD